MTFNLSLNILEFILFLNNLLFFRLSWFIIYGIFVLFLSAVCVVLLYSLKVFTNTNFLLIFVLIVLYCFSIIMFGFMITPFFDKSGVSTHVLINHHLINYFTRFFFDYIIQMFNSCRMFSRLFQLILFEKIIPTSLGKKINKLWSPKNGKKCYLCTGGEYTMRFILLALL